MSFDPERHHRRSIRLKDYDYAQTGAYFVTICTQDRACLFGDIVDGEIRLNDTGRMVSQWWGKLAKKFSAVKIDIFIIMPNHLHGTLFIVGADPRVCPKGQGAHTGAPLPRILQWFKTMTTNAYIRGVKHYDWPAFPGKLWQRNYHDRIIRDEDELNRIQEYIANNPARWAEDENNPVNLLNKDNKP